MGNSFSLSDIPDYNARIDTNDGKTFTISYHSLVEHILLLRKVIHHPEMTEVGEILDYYIKDYLNRMAQKEMQIKDQQLKLPWQVEWIWHVHRLHPIAYLNDCNKQLSDGLVDKKAQKFIKKSKKKIHMKGKLPPVNNETSFVSSVDLTKAVLRQKDFLDKFQKHPLYSYDLKQLNINNIQNLVQDYVSFIKLAKKNQLLVPTFDIDIIWHTHMRFPSKYHEFCITLCGFILDHDDSIESNVLNDAYQVTADRWKETYESDYGKHIDRKHLERLRFLNTCAMISLPIVVPTKTGKTTNTTFVAGCATGCGTGVSSCGGCGGCDGGDGGGGCDGGGCGGGCGGGGGD